MARRVTAKGQVTLPKKVREQLGIRPGDAVEFTMGPGGAVELRSVHDPDAFRRAIEDVLRRRPAGDMTTDEYMSMIRDEP